jgi:tetratricopeptide (TPR) repeat protein
MNAAYASPGAVSIAMRRGEKELEASYWEMAGNALFRLHEFSYAERALTEALKMRRILAKENPEAYIPYLATTLNSLGLLYKSTEKFSKAEKVYAEALKKYRELAKTAPDMYSPYVAMSLNNLSNIYSSKGKFSEAEKAYMKALGIYTIKEYPSYHKIVKSNLKKIERRMKS